MRIKLALRDSVFGQRVHLFSSDLFAALFAELRDRRRALRTRLVRTFRTLNFRLFDGPDWLSMRADALRDIRYRRFKSERLSTSEWFHRLLHRLHSIRASMTLYGVVLAVLVSAALIFADTRPVAPQGTYPRVETESLTTTAEVLAGAAGILFAVIIFGIQFHGEKLGNASYFARYFSRWEGLVPIAAFILGVVSANGATAILARLFYPGAASPLAVMDAVLLPISLGLTLWLLYRMVVSVSGDFFESSVIPALSREYQMALDEELYYSGLTTEFSAVLNSLGLEYSPFAGWLGPDFGETFSYRLSTRGRVMDIDLRSLGKLAKYISASYPGYQTGIGLQPGSQLDNEQNTPAAIVLKYVRIFPSGLAAETATATPSGDDKLRRLVQSTFRVGGVPDSDVIELVKRFWSSLQVQARYDRADQLERALRIQDTLVQLRLTYPLVNERVESVIRQSEPDFLGEFGFIDMADAVVAAADCEKARVVVQCAYRMITASFEQQNVPLFKKATGILTVLYVRTRDGSKLGSLVSERLDNFILDSLKYCLRTSPSNAGTDRKLGATPIVVRALAWLVNLIKIAVDNDQTDDAQHFFGRLNSQVHLTDHTQKNEYDEQRANPEQREINDLNRLARFLIAAWCLHLLRNPTTANSAAKSVFSRSLETLGTRHALLATLEGAYANGHDLLNSFCVINWTLSPEKRTGVYTVQSRDPFEFILDCLVAAMLSRPSAAAWNTPPAILEPPRVVLCAVTEVRTRAEAFLAADSIRKDILQISDADRARALNDIIELFESREHLCKHDQGNQSSSAF